MVANFQTKVAFSEEIYLDFRSRRNWDKVSSINHHFSVLKQVEIFEILIQLRTN